MPEQKKIISPPEDRFKKLEQQRKRQKLYQCQKEANNEVERAELLKLVPVTEAEAKLNPKLQARLDDVTTGVDRLCVESTEPQLRWIEEECICLSSSEADGWLYVPYKYGCQMYVPYKYGCPTRGKLQFCQTRPGKTTSQPHNYELIREATDFNNRYQFIKEKGLLKEGMKISYRECGRCGCQTHLNYDDHMKECNNMFEIIDKQRKRLKAIEDLGRKFTASDVEVNDPKDDRTRGFLMGRYYLSTIIINILTFLCLHLLPVALPLLTARNKENL